MSLEGQELDLAWWCDVHTWWTSNLAMVGSESTELWVEEDICGHILVAHN